MKRVKFNGKKRNEGRFGMIAKHDILDMTEQEFLSVLDDPEWELQDEDKVFAKKPKLPKGTPSYDLRTLPVTQPNFFLWVSRRGKATLRNIIKGMREAGMTVNCPEGHALQISDMADAICEQIIAHKWMTLTPEAISSAGVVSEKKVSKTKSKESKEAKAKAKEAKAKAKAAKTKAKEAKAKEAKEAKAKEAKAKAAKTKAKEDKAASKESAEDDKANVAPTNKTEDAITKEESPKVPAKKAATKKVAKKATKKVAKKAAKKITK